MVSLLFTEIKFSSSLSSQTPVIYVSILKLSMRSPEDLYICRYEPPETCAHLGMLEDWFLYE